MVGNPPNDPRRNDPNHEGGEELSNDLLSVTPFSETRKTGHRPRRVALGRIALTFLAMLVH